MRVFKKFEMEMIAKALESRIKYLDKAIERGQKFIDRCAEWENQAPNTPQDLEKVLTDAHKGVMNGRKERAEQTALLNEINFLMEHGKE